MKCSLKAWANKFSFPPPFCFYYSACPMPRLVTKHVFVCKSYPFYGCSIGFLNYSDSLMLFVFHFIISDFCTTPAPPTTTLAPSMCTYNL